MQTWTNIHDIWYFNVNLHDKYTLTIGTIFRFFATQPVQRLPEGNIPPLFSKFKGVIYKSPSNKFLVLIDLQVQRDTEAAVIRHNYH